MGSRTSTAMLAAELGPLVRWISRSTVLIVEEGELGSGGKGVVLEASEVVFAASITGAVLVRYVLGVEFRLGIWWGTCVAIAGEIDSDLAPYTARCTDDEGYGL